MRLREEKHFLLSFHKPDANHTAGADSNLCLSLLISGIARRGCLFGVFQNMSSRVQLRDEVMLRIDEIDRPAEPVRFHRDKHYTEEKAKGGGCRKKAGIEPGGEHDDNGHHHQNDGRPQIGDRYEKGYSADRKRNGKQRVFFVNGPEPLRQEIRQKQRQRRLRELDDAGTRS